MIEVAGMMRAPIEVTVIRALRGEERLCCPSIEDPIAAPGARFEVLGECKAWRP